MNHSLAIKTPETDPGHHVVGKHWGGYSTKHRKTAVFFCDSFDPSCGYWMTNAADPADRKNVSTNAICRTYWAAEKEGDYWWIPQWGQKVSQTGEVLPKYGELGWTPRILPTSA